MTPILSIVIPTRNRVECAASCIEAALEATQRSEIVVADSGDGDDLWHAIQARGLDTARVRYVRTPPDWNVVENFEGALTHCRGEFVLYLGDDDLVGPHIEQVCEWAARNRVDAVVGYGNRFGVAYYWPGVTSKYFGDAYAGRVFVWSHTGKVTRIDPREQIAAAERNVGGGLARLPRVYHGLVARELLDRVRQRHGRVFGGVSPDIFSAVLIADASRNPVFLDYPFCIPGASPRSEAGSGAARTDRQRFEDSPYLKRFAGLQWDPAIPRFFAPYNVWAYSLNEALKLRGRPLTPASLGRLYARCLVYCWSYRSEVMRCVELAAHQQGRASAWYHLAAGLASEAAHAVARLGAKALAPRAGGWATRHGPFEDSLAAFRFLRQRLPAPDLAPLG